LFLAELSAISRERPVAFSFASLGDEFVVRGLTIGEGPARALQKRFEQGFFRIDEFIMARSGGCRRFEALGRSPVVGIQAELPMPAEEPFRQDPAPCRVDRDTGGVRLVKGPSRKPSEGGPLTLRLREVDAADVFHALHLISAESFIVDDNVQGLVSTELNRVTLDEALAALQRRLDVRIEKAGVVRRVRLAQAAPTPTLPTPSQAAPLASFALKRAPVREILAVMTEADADLAALGPDGFLGRVSVWAKDVSLVDLRTAILASVGLSERLEDGQRILERAVGSTEPAVPVAGDPPERRLLVRPQDLSVVELQLAGLASSGSGWIAFAYSPRGDLHSYSAGTRLDDAVVKAVYSTDIVLDTGDGEVRLGLAGEGR
jgi:hypothetical protein